MYSMQGKRFNLYAIETNLIYEAQFCLFECLSASLSVLTPPKLPGVLTSNWARLIASSW